MFTLCNYAEHELAVEIIALFEVSLFDAKICKKIVKNHTCEKIKFSTLMANFRLVLLEIIETNEYVYSL